MHEKVLKIVETLCTFFSYQCQFGHGVKGNFYIRRARKREVLQELEALLRREQKQSEDDMFGGSGGGTSGKGKGRIGLDEYDDDDEGGASFDEDDDSASRVTLQKYFA